MVDGIGLWDQRGFDLLRDELAEDFPLLVDTYCQLLPERMNAIVGHFQADDQHALSEVAHTLKGASGNLCFTRAYELCKLLEQSARHGERQVQATLVQELSVTVEAMLRELAPYRQEV